MSYFEFILIMLSIIIGLGIAELLTNVARQIKAGKTCKGYWVQSLVVLTILVALFQQWWESWGLQQVDNWNFPIVLMMMTPSIGLFIIAHLLFPEKIENADLKTHYFSIAKRSWGIAAMVVIVSTLFRPVAFGEQLLDMDNAASLFLVLIFLALSISKNNRLSEFLVPVIFSAVVLDILVFNLSI